MNLTIENSWHFEGGLWQDSDLERVKKTALSYRPQVFSPQELKPDTLWTLRGPRRVGKTVALKLIIAQLIEQVGVEAKNILWTSVENIRDLLQLEEHVQTLLMRSPKFLFIDEVTAVIGWQNVIKKIKDQGKLQNCCLVLTGSSAYDLKAGSERLAGRKGVYVSTDRVLLPIQFNEFLAQGSHLTIDDYIVSGGFPFRVNALLEQKQKKQAFDNEFGMSVFDDVFFYEFSRRKLDRSIALEVIYRLSQIQPHATSYTAFAKNINVKPDTVKKYLDALGDAFLLATIYSFDTARSRVALKKDKKFVWVDPALSYLPHALGQGERPQPNSIIEQLVGIELIRNFELRLFEGLSAPRNVFTWKSSSGNEIDYMVVNRAEKLQFPIEVKIQNEISDWDFQVMERAFKKGIIITKNIDKKRPKTKALPLATFLSLPDKLGEL